jgi:hypothetical protein
MLLVRAGTTVMTTQEGADANVGPDGPKAQELHNFPQCWALLHAQGSLKVGHSQVIAQTQTMYATRSSPDRATSMRR